MTIKQTKTVYINHKKPPYDILKSLTEFEKPHIRQIDNSLMKLGNNIGGAQKLIDLILDMSEKKFIVEHQDGNNQSVIHEVKD